MFANINILLCLLNLLDRICFCNLVLTWLCVRKANYKSVFNSALYFRFSSLPNLLCFFHLKALNRFSKRLLDIFIKTFVFLFANFHLSMNQLIEVLLFFLLCGGFRFFLHAIWVWHMLSVFGPCATIRATLGQISFNYRSRKGSLGLTGFIFLQVASTLSSKQVSFRDWQWHWQCGFFIHWLIAVQANCSRTTKV